MPNTSQSPVFWAEFCFEALRLTGGGQFVMFECDGEEGARQRQMSDKLVKTILGVAVRVQGAALLFQS